MIIWYFGPLMILTPSAKNHLILVLLAWADAKKVRLPRVDPFDNV